MRYTLPLTRTSLFLEGSYSGGSNSATPQNLDTSPNKPHTMIMSYRLWIHHNNPPRHTCVTEFTTLGTAIREASRDLGRPSRVAPGQAYHIVGHGKHVAGVRGVSRPRKLHDTTPQPPTHTPSEIELPANHPPILLYRDTTLVGCYHTMSALKTALPHGRAPWHWRVYTHGVLTHEGRSRWRLRRTS